MDWTQFIVQEWVWFGLLAGLIIALLVVESKKGGAVLSHHEVTQLLNRDEAVLVDVRESKDYKVGHISSAINIPHNKIKDADGQLAKYKSKTIVIVDKLGQHAGHCGKVLKEKGYNTVRLKGGMTEWLTQNLPVQKA